MKSLIITLFSIILAGIMLFGLTSCGGSGDSNTQPETSISEETTVAEDTTNAQTEAETEAQTAAQNNDDNQSGDKNSNSGKTDIKKIKNKPTVPYNTIYLDLLRKQRNIKYFEVIYVDEDDIPELACFNGDAHLDQVTLFTIYNNHAVKVGKYGQYGSMAYAKNRNRIFAYTGIEENDKLAAKYTYMLRKGKAVKAPDNKGYKIILAGNDGKFLENTIENINNTFKK